jgi:ElaA protein
VPLRDAAFADLDVATLYGLLRLRVDVFVVEQACAYADLDGRDLEPEARHCWIDEDGTVVACLRLLRDADSWRIGRVATAAHARGRGMASTLVVHALTLVDGPVRLDAQSHLTGMYERLGFVVDGDDFVEDGILHTPMRLPRP